MPPIKKCGIRGFELLMISVGERRMDDMKKMIVCMVLAMVMGISGCLSFAPVEPGDNRPWDGLHDPYRIPSGGGR